MSFGKKFSFKRLVLVASLTLTGLFGIGCHFINNYRDNIEETQQANASESNYKIVWYYIASSWEENNSFTSKMCFSYTTTSGQKQGTDIYIGTSGDGYYSEVHGGRIAKIFLPSDANKINFKSVSGSPGDRAQTGLMDIDDDVFVLTSNHFNLWDPYQTGYWMSFDEFIGASGDEPWVKPIWITVLSGWNGGYNSISNFWIWEYHYLYKDDSGNRETKNRTYQLTSVDTKRINGIIYARLLIPCHKGANGYPDSYVNQLVIEESEGASRYNEKTDNLSYSNFIDTDNNAFYIYTNYTYSDNTTQQGWWDSFDTKLLFVDIDLNSKFKESGANPSIRYYDGTNTYYKTLYLLNNNIYVITAPKLVFTGTYGEGFRLYCWNNKDVTNDCTTEWLAHTILQYDFYDYICLGQYSTGVVNGIEGCGFYKNETTNPASPTPDTQRIWLKNDTPDFYNNDKWGSPCKNVIGYLHNDCWYTIEMPSVYNEKNFNYYFYADIPTTVMDIHFYRMSRAANHSYIAYLDGWVSSMTYGKCYYSGTHDYNDFINISVGTVSGADENVLVKVLEAFYTCKSDASNGGANATTVANIKSAWIDNNNADMTETFSDYAPMDIDYSGGRVHTVSLAEKWAAMGSGRYVPTSMMRYFDIFNKNNDSSAPIIIVIVSSISLLLSITTLSILIVKRKRKGHVN